MKRMGVAAVMLTVVLVFGGVVGMAMGQTDRGDQAKGTVIAQAPGPGGGMGAGVAARLEELRQQLTAAGATDADLQAIKSFVTDQMQIMMPLRQSLMALREASGPNATDEQAKAAVTKYEEAMKTAKEQVAKAEADLKATLQLADKPKLHAVLLSNGILDNGMRMGAGMMGGRPGGPGGPGGAGRGGMRGGRGPAPG